MSVRLAGPGDVEVVARLLAEFNEHNGRDWPPEAAIRAGVERLIARDDTEYLLGGDPPAGVVGLRYRYGVWWDGEDCNVEDVFVRAEARGTGLGRALVSPIQGTVLKVAVEQGAQVEAGALIAVIEAMKMENEITAHKAGTIAELPIKEGEAVTAGALLAVIKSE